MNCGVGASTTLRACEWHQAEPALLPATQITTGIRDCRSSQRDSKCDAGELILLLFRFLRIGHQTMGSTGCLYPSLWRMTGRRGRAQPDCQCGDDIKYETCRRSPASSYVSQKTPQARSIPTKLQSQSAHCFGEQRAPSQSVRAQNCPLAVCLTGRLQLRSSGGSLVIKTLPPLQT